MPTSRAAETLGARIREARSARGLSRETLAQLAGVDVASLGRVERGVTLVSLDTLVRIAATLEVRPGGWIDDLDPSDLPPKRAVFSARDYLAERERRSKD